MIVSYRKVLALFLMGGCLQASEQLQQELAQTNLFPAVIDGLITEYTGAQDPALMKLERVVQKHLPTDLAQHVIEYAAIEGDIFVVPNASAQNTDFEFDFQKKPIINIVGTQIFDNQEEIYVYMWLQSPTCDDWQSVQHPELPKYNSYNSIPNFFPISIFAGKKELTTNPQERIIWLATDGRPLKLTLNNLSYKYRNMGSFDKALRRVICGIRSGNFEQADRKAFEAEQAALAAEKKDNETSS